MKTMLKRGAGILMPISSLPSPYGIGTFGKAAYEFIDYLKKAGQKYWQVLPMGPTSYGDSPYQSFSAFAGNPYFIDLDMLVEEGLLTQEEIDACDWGDQPESVSYDKMFQYRYPLLKKAFARSKFQDENAYKKFRRENKYWLDDYAFYMALKFHFDNKDWQNWPENIKLRKPTAVKRYKKELKEEMNYWKFMQYKFYEQWKKLRKYANAAGISIIGDIPIYVALDNADVWTHPEQFWLDEKDLKPLKVAGVPPDAFSDDGQLWGNPLYRWDVMEETGFEWWKERMKSQAKLFDVVRIDHFIGVVRYYAIPGGAVHGRDGVYEQGPGKKLTDAIDSVIGDTKIIAEDLGAITPEVRKLLEETGYPGMKIMQFGFGGDHYSEHLPHMYSPNYVVYGGTHDNETLVGYYTPEKRSASELQYMADYMGITEKEDLVDRIMFTAYASVASVVIFQTQDILKLDNSARMNMPSTVGNNWKWRMQSGQLTDEHAEQLKKLADLFGRI